MVAEGWNYENDTLRVVNPSSGGSSKKVVWLTADEAKDGGVGEKAGWYDADEFTFEGDTEFDLGSGFMTSLVSKDVSFMYSGEVYDQAFTIPCDGKKYVIIPNALPRKMKLSEMIATGWNYENDQLRLLNKSTGGSSKKFVWLTADEAKDGGVGDKAGWYDADEFTYEGDTEVDPGDGFMTSLVSASVKISLPAAITAK